ncbi:MAG TPA: nucleoside triphosphate hydrolase [Pseudorhizobium sp.]|nr:nucleoside triphosphate hydrolase [Pseudorhizobium sp.]
MNLDVSELAGQLVQRGSSAVRIVVAIAGPPGSGKSTLAERLATALNTKGEEAAVVPMDGFHMDDAVLQEKGLLARKGSPQTFDVRGLLDIVLALKLADVEVLVPLFDRTRELAVAAARTIPKTTRFVLVEGNYLLLDDLPWSRLAAHFDISIMLMPPEDVLEDRLMRRWLDLGLDPAAAREKVHSNDLPNGRLVRNRSRKADITLS